MEKKHILGYFERGFDFYEKAFLEFKFGTSYLNKHERKRIWDLIWDLIEKTDDAIANFEVVIREILNK